MIRRAVFGDTSLIVWQMVFQNLLRIVSSMVLTRLLSADDFAVVGVITSVLVTVALVSDIGVGAFIVRDERTVERRFRDEVWTLRLARGIILSVLTAVFAGPLANFMEKPALAPVIAVAGLTSLIDGLGSLAPIVALRSRKVRKLIGIDVGAQILGLAISIGLAAVIGSYWAIILSNLISQALGVVFSYVLYDDSSQRWRLSMQRSAELWRFSRFITGSTILTLAITQGDKLILSRLLPLDVLGLYVIAGGLAMAPMALVSGYAGRILYPLLAEVRREAPETLAWRFYHDRMVPTLLYAFAAGGLIGFGPSLIVLLYDPRYTGAGAYLQIMAIAPFFMMGNYAANEVMIALGHPRFTFTVNVVRLIYLLVAGWLGWTFLGVIGIVWAVGTVEVVAQLYGWIALRRQAILDLRYEMLFLLVGGAGLSVGAAADFVIRHVLKIA
ncbi:oligosaccharide flippase family protein [Sphingomonas metalli]|nr:oligosaccharide flippase family protein [Sphingomonas metalli]